MRLFQNDVSYQEDSEVWAKALQFRETDSEVDVDHETWKGKGQFKYRFNYQDALKKVLGEVHHSLNLNNFVWPSFGNDDTNAHITDESSAHRLRLLYSKKKTVFKSYRVQGSQT